MGAHYGGDGQNFTYWYIYKGELRKKVTESEAVNPADGQLLPTYVRRKNKNDDIVFERVAFGGIDGFVKQVEWADGKFGKEIRVLLEDNEGESNLITFQALGQKGSFQNYAGSFCDQLSLVDYKKPLKLLPYDLEKDDKRYTGVSLQQPNDANGSFTKVKELWPDASDKLWKAKPKAESTKAFDGSVTWDFSKPSKWQYDQLLKNIDRLSKYLSESKPVAASNPTEPPAQEEGDPSDDLPF